MRLGRRLIFDLPSAFHEILGWRLDAMTTWLPLIGWPMPPPIAAIANR